MRMKELTFGYKISIFLKVLFPSISNEPGLLSDEFVGGDLGFDIPMFEQPIVGHILSNLLFLFVEDENLPLFVFYFGNRVQLGFQVVTATWELEGCLNILNST